MATTAIDATTKAIEQAIQQSLEERGAPAELRGATVEQVEIYASGAGWWIDWGIVSGKDGYIDIWGWPDAGAEPRKDWVIRIPFEDESAAPPEPTEAEHRQEAERIAAALGGISVDTDDCPAGFAVTLKVSHVFETWKGARGFLDHLAAEQIYAAKHGLEEEPPEY